MSGNTNKRISAAEVTRDTLRRQILSGEYAPLDMLPGERVLSETLEVSRLTLRSALAGLESEGLIEKVHGAGNRVLPFRDSSGIEMVGHLARYDLEAGRIPVGLLADLLEFRRFIAGQVLSIAAERATPEQLRGMRQQIEVLAGVTHDAERFMEEDLAFARLMVQSTNNLAMELLYTTVLRVIRSSAAFEAAFAVNASETVRVYRLLADEIEARDPRRVAKLAGKVLGPLDRRTLDRLSELAEVLGTSLEGSNSGEGRIALDESKAQQETPNLGRAKTSQRQEDDREQETVKGKNR